MRESRNYFVTAILNFDQSFSFTRIGIKCNWCKTLTPLKTGELLTGNEECLHRADCPYLKASMSKAIQLGVKK